jgi:hypothetical protein
MTRKTIIGILMALLLGTTCAAASGSGAAASQSVRLEVVPVVEVGFDPLSENSDSEDADQTTTDEVAFGNSSLVVSPEGFDAKITVTSEPGTIVEVSVKAQAGDGGYPKAAIRLTLTDP